jgi:hypothetical protein
VSFHHYELRVGLLHDLLHGVGFHHQPLHQPPPRWWGKAPGTR